MDACGHRATQADRRTDRLLDTEKKAERTYYIYGQLINRQLTRYMGQKYYCMPKASIAVVRNHFFGNNSGIPEPIGTEFYKAPSTTSV